jgi:hypothetical protein
LDLQELVLFEEYLKSLTHGMSLTGCSTVVNLALRVRWHPGAWC